MKLTTLVPPEIRAKLTGKSLWQLRYVDGRTITEGEVDWSLAPAQGRQSVRLYCPNGQVAELGNTKDATDRIWQLKVASTLHGTLAHVVGLITDTDGATTYAAWEYDPGRLVQGTDNVFGMRYRGIGRICADHVGIRPD